VINFKLQVILSRWTTFIDGSSSNNFTVSSFIFYYYNIQLNNLISLSETGVVFSEGNIKDTLTSFTKEHICTTFCRFFALNPFAEPENLQVQAEDEQYNSHGLS